MADAIDDLIFQLERFAGLTALPQTAREIIQSAINDRVREALENVAREARRYAESYQVKAAAEAPLLLVEPQPRKRPRKKGLSNAQKADYWGGLEQTIRSQMPSSPQGSAPRATQAHKLTATL